ncbi:hypothetical protein BKA69DRAFT_1139614 [Paraphysoderma sedebokerense]|nr:hypothetical protein BKA69DRAFT_1139614 [Paraphysoderma sedebokerense]
MLYANAQKFYRLQFTRRQETSAAIPTSGDAPNPTVKPADSEQTVSEWKDVEDLTTVSLRSVMKKAEEEIAVVAQSVRSRGDTKFLPFLKNFGRRNQGSEHRLPQLTMCADVILEKGLEAQGIFRISGMKNEVDALIRNHGTADTVEFTNEVNVYSVADAFKLFLARLQSPVIPTKLYPLLKHIWINRAMGDTSELNAKQIDFQSLQDSSGRLKVDGEQNSRTF